MTGRPTARIELAIDAIASALFAAAAVYALAALSAGVPLGAGAPLAFGLCFAALRRIEVEPRHPHTGEPATRPMPQTERAELVLTDRLPGIGPDSRVVQLFDPAAMPTSRQPNAARARPTNHRPGPGPDASQELLDALADLRRSLN
jgi:hypothetical protein